MEVDFKGLKEDIGKETRRLREENYKAKIEGDFHTYQCNCNVLNGISIVKSLIKKWEY